MRGARSIDPPGGSLRARGGSLTYIYFNAANFKISELSKKLVFKTFLNFKFSKFQTFKERCLREISLREISERDLSRDLSKRDLSKEISERDLSSLREISKRD